VIVSFQWHASSTSGSRKLENDDACIIFSAGLHGSKCLPEEFELSTDDDDIIFAVSDGMGGDNAGDLASKLILEHISNSIPKIFKNAAQGFHPDYLSHLEIAIDKVHNAVNNAGNAHPDHHGMGATLTLAWFTPENLYIANVGDSRIYLHRDGITTLLSQDHTFAWNQFKRGEITEREFRFHPRKSVLYQVIGANNRSVKPQITTIPYQAGDKFLLCSDGIIDGIWEKHIHSAFIENSDSKESISSLHDKLLTRALANAGIDDTTLITLSIS